MSIWDIITIIMPVLSKYVDKLVIPETRLDGYGFIHKRDKVEIDGIRGELIWDYILFNEITFDDNKGKKIRFFTSPSDVQTQLTWDKLINKFGV